MLDKRLQTCLEMVGGNGVVCDVGTDHALLAAELINSGKCQRVIASDIKEGPLEAARKTVEKYGISDKVGLVLSDGLENVPLDGVSDIVIAGMGGETIADIIRNATIDRSAAIRLVLQPMSKPEILRKKLYEYQFAITEERVVEDGDKMYVVMSAEPSWECEQLTETESIYGFFDGDPLAEKYRRREADRLGKIAENLGKAGKTDEAAHYKALSYRMEHGTDIVDLGALYNHLDSVFPFALQESYDNSGLLVENMTMDARCVLLSLDITEQAVREAEEKGADVIISHHPVIFSPRKRMSRFDPVYSLISANIAAICMHTNVDIAKGGTNGVILKKLSSRFGISGEPEPFEDLGSGNGIGWVLELSEAVSSDELARAAKEILGCEYVRMSANGAAKVKRIAFCSGSGGSLLGLALAKNCDALITGDVKHDVWIEANNRNITLLDCGHFHTENPVLWELRRVIEEKFPQLDVEIAEASTDPCVYI